MSQENGIEISDAELKKNAEKEFVKNEMKATTPYAIGGLIFVCVICILFLADLLPDLSAGVKPENLTSFSSKSELVFRYQAINVSWLLFSMFYVVSKRASSGAINPLAGYEGHVQAAAKHFNNTIEQFIMTLTSQLVLVSFISAQTAVRIIPLVNFLFIFGRIAYLIGYPRYRSLGFIIGLFPISAMTIYNLYQFSKIYFSSV